MCNYKWIRSWFCWKSLPFKVLKLLTFLRANTDKTDQLTNSFLIIISRSYFDDNVCCYKKGYSSKLRCLIRLHLSIDRNSTCWSFYSVVSKIRSFKKYKQGEQTIQSLNSSWYVSWILLLVNIWSMVIFSAQWSINNLVQNHH